KFRSAPANPAAPKCNGSCVGGRSGPVEPRRRIRVWLGWFAVLNLLWLGLVVTFNWHEEVVGVIGSAIGAAAAEAVQAQGVLPLAGCCPLLWVCLHRAILGALAAVALAGAITTLVLLSIARGAPRQAFFGLALIPALLSFGGGLAFARFLERWVWGRADVRRRR